MTHNRPGRNRNSRRIWIGVGAVVLVFLCVGSGLIGASLSRNFGTSNYTLSYADFISIMLTAISLLMTVLAIFLAVFGVIGWNSITSKVNDKTTDFLEEEFKEGNSLYVMLRTRATEIMYEGVAEINFDANSDHEREEQS